MAAVEIVRWHHQLNGHESEQIAGDSGRQGSLGAAAHEVTKRQTRLSDWTKTTQISHCVCASVCVSVSVRVCLCVCVCPMLSEAAQGVGTDLLCESGDLGSTLQSKTNHQTSTAAMENSVEIS